MEYGLQIDMRFFQPPYLTATCVQAGKSGHRIGAKHSNRKGLIMNRDGDENAKADVDSSIYNEHYQLQPGDVVLDIGAHVGYYTEYAFNKVGPRGLVVALEPHPENFQILHRRFNPARNVILHECAAWDSVGEKELWQRPGNTGGHSLVEQTGFGDPIWVLTSISRYYLPGPEFPVRFVKLDAEGAEAVILSDLLPRLNILVDIAFETHSEALFKECEKLLKFWGFTLKEQQPIVGVCHAWK